MQLLNNSQGVDFPGLTIHPEQTTQEQYLAEIVIHAASVLQCVDYDDLLEPLRMLLLDPKSLQVRLLLLQNLLKGGSSVCEHLSCM